MNVQQYLARREQQNLAQRSLPGRKLCIKCLQPERTCYCVHVQTFDPKLKFAILIHRLEVHRRIATGRMSHLCLQNSDLLMGYDYSHDLRVNALLADPQFHPVILYPGQRSTNLSSLSTAERTALFPAGKKPLIFVIDGTWSTAKKTLRRSINLHQVPQICFTPERPSRFRVRQQPKAHCISTLEAIHQTIELLGPIVGFDVASREHDRLLYVFDKMVEQQLEFIRLSHQTERHSRHPRKNKWLQSLAKRALHPEI
ncbi:MAG: tRNA-uridine aminocarboxypropyltransferase [Bdellovibrionales bacterium]